MEITDQRLFDEVADVIVDNVCVSKDLVKPETNLIDDLSCEPIDVAMLVVELEAKFSVSISDEELERTNYNVGEIYACIMNKKKEK